LSLSERNFVGYERAPTLLEDVPFCTFASFCNFAEQYPHTTKILGRGNSGLVVGVENIAVKIGFGWGLDEKRVEQLTNIIYPDHETRREILRRKFEMEFIEHLSSFESQAAAQIVGHRITPQYIDDTVALLIEGRKCCGMFMPAYVGEFVTVDTVLPRNEKQLLVDAGIRIDDFVHRKNAVKTLNGIKLFDLDIHPSYLR